MKLILASQSPRRKHFLMQMGVKFEIIAPKRDEIVNKNLSFGQIVTDIAKQKATEIYEQTSGDRLIIGSDTLVAHNNQILGKPTSEADAKRMLTMLSGSHHHAYTGLCVLIERNGVLTTYTDFDEIEVFFKQIPKHIIDAYVATKEPMDKAGAYTISGIGGIFLEKINGNPASIVGLPIAKLYDIFLKENIPFFEFGGNQN